MWTYQQDGASSHKSEETHEWIARNFPDFTSKDLSRQRPRHWPANLSDLDPKKNQHQHSQQLLRLPNPKQARRLPPSPRKNPPNLERYALSEESLDFYVYPISIQFSENFSAR
ncbi:hypothetical protein ANCDUO_26433 [Ancylostoma duodenale]|uniref:Tc1-like transposase DDE domain-containing protein n=1 Tax=Ancylostoma duodenale TaxID=51022 RepID=A0A0C2F9J5_9BILA|nr:hypothetical protein ANCDUO_26433 [Ancylostoma duodenale]